MSFCKKCLFFLLFIALPFSAQADDWSRLESDHFVLYSNNGPELSRNYLINLERFHHLLKTFHSIGDAGQVYPKLDIYFLSSFDDLKETWPAADEMVQGYFTSSDIGIAAFSINQHDGMRARTSGIRRSERDRSLDENVSQTILFHEYGHHFMFQIDAVRYPPWFVEGFAEFYSTTRFEGPKVIVGMQSYMRSDGLIGEKGINYADIISEKSDAYKEQIDLFYAQSWLLSHYIMSSPQRREQFRGFLEAYNTGTPPLEAFKASFGFPAADLRKVLQPYLMKLNALVYTERNVTEPKITVTAMPLSARRLLLWDASVKVGHGKYKPYLDLIRTEAARFPQDTYAQMVLARAENELGDPLKAVSILEPYLSTHETSAEGLFLLGQAYYKLSSQKEKEGGEALLTKSRTALSKAYKLDALNAPNLYYLAKVQLELSSPRNTLAVNSALQAHYLSPSVRSYAILAAQLLIINDRRTEAKDILFQMASNPHQTGLAKMAEKVIKAIDSNADTQTVLNGFESTEGDDD